MKQETIFLASEDIARRTGIKESLYRTKDGKYILSEKDIRSAKFQMTPDEFVNGLDIKVISKTEAMKLIDNGATLGLPEGATEEEVTEEEPKEEEDK